MDRKPRRPILLVQPIRENLVWAVGNETRANGDRAASGVEFGMSRFPGAQPRPEIYTTYCVQITKYTKYGVLRTDVQI